MIGNAMPTPTFDDATRDRLIAAARDAATRAHAPYSNFGVGAALLLNDGSVMTGANFENASYGLSLCAETVALATASSAGRLADVFAVGVIGGAIRDGAVIGETPVSPCGRCRQVINEAAQIGLGVGPAGSPGGTLNTDRLPLPADAVARN